MIHIDFWNEDIETAPRERIQDIQLQRLRKLVDYCRERVPFYKKKLDDAGITGEHIKHIDDIEKIPFTEKKDFLDNYPNGLFAVPRKEIVRIHASSGTTGKPTVVGYTRNDIDMWSENMARLVVAAGASDEDTAQICFGYGLFTGALGLHYALEKIGAAVVPISSGNTEKQLMVMKDFETTLIISTPSYALYMGESAKEAGYKRSDFKLNKAMLGSEGCTEEQRAKIEELWGIEVTDNYGMSELIGPGVSGECIYKDGLHINEDHFLPEICDINSMRHVSDGGAGELVITTLTKEALPLLRYRTKDITDIRYNTCRCGRTSARMSKITGRSDDMIKIKGVNVFPSQIENIILAIPNVSPHYRIVLHTENFIDKMEIEVEFDDASLLEKYSELEKLQEQIRHKVKTHVGIDIKVTLVAPKSLERYTGKAKRVFDSRTK
ncbi:phenylacetate-coenzyme A ligase [Clostridia bacterium]|nr:phenylacetate-coenzyme A ligase [Clostridia bacterium]